MKKQPKIIIIDTELGQVEMTPAEMTPDQKKVHEQEVQTQIDEATKTHPKN